MSLSAVPSTLQVRFCARTRKKPKYCIEPRPISFQEIGPLDGRMGTPYHPLTDSRAGRRALPICIAGHQPDQLRIDPCRAAAN